MIRHDPMGVVKRRIGLPCPERHSASAALVDIDGVSSLARRDRRRRREKVF